MIQKKICMVGTSGVGKTSLVSRFVRSIFSDKYLTTVGVKIDKKSFSLSGTEITLMIWDLAGVDEFHERINPSFLRGSSGCLLVADGTRAVTLNKALEIHSDVIDVVGTVPFVLLINKADLQSQWEISDDRIHNLECHWPIVRTSAKTGDGVEQAFLSLAERMF